LETNSAGLARNPQKACGMLSEMITRKGSQGKSAQRKTENRFGENWNGGLGFGNL
jgi:hypothetical protein